MPKPENLLPFKWIKGKSGNPNGRPRKPTTEVLLALKEAGLQPVSVKEIESVFATILGLPYDDIAALRDDTEQPYLIRKCAEKLLSDDDYIERVLDRVAGKPTQALTTKDEQGNTQPIGITGVMLLPTKPIREEESDLDE